MGGVFGQVIGLTVIFTPWLLLAVFLIALASEFGVMVPFLMETAWLFSGYNVALGIISPGFLIVLCLVGLVGRQVGSSALFHLSCFGSTPLGVFYRKSIKPRLSKRLNSSGSFQKIIYAVTAILKRFNMHPSHSVLGNAGGNSSIRLLGRTFRLSPLTIALGRFLWLRLPITIAMGVMRKRMSLFWGVVIFSIIWDGTYIIIGVLGGRGGLDPVQMLLYPIGTMIIVYIVVFGLKRVRSIVSSS